MSFGDFEAIWIGYTTILLLKLSDNRKFQYGGPETGSCAKKANLSYKTTCIECKSILTIVCLPTFTRAPPEDIKPSRKKSWTHRYQRWRPLNRKYLHKEFDNRCRIAIKNVSEPGNSSLLLDNTKKGSKCRQMYRRHRPTPEFKMAAVEPEVVIS